MGQSELASTMTWEKSAAAVVPVAKDEVERVDDDTVALCAGRALTQHSAQKGLGDTSAHFLVHRAAHRRLRGARPRKAEQPHVEALCVHEGRKQRAWKRHIAVTGIQVGHEPRQHHRLEVLRCGTDAPVVYGCIVPAKARVTV